MTGDEIAFWLMMAFSCVIGILIGYLLFSPRISSREEDYETQLGTQVEPEPHDDRFFNPDDELAADTATQPEPFFEETPESRALARERARARMAGLEQADRARHPRDDRHRAVQAANAANESIAARASDLFGPEATDPPDQNSGPNRQRGSGRRAA